MEFSNWDYGENMDIKNKRNTFPLLNVLGRVGWLDDSVIKNERDDYLLPCGWTQCNLRFSSQLWDGRHFPSTKFSDEQTLSRPALTIGQSGRLSKIMADVRKYVRL